MKKITLQTRREFLRGTLLTSALSWTVPAFLANTFSSIQADAADRTTQVITGRDGSILVVLQMAGGNDGLNTVIPIGNEFYEEARPRLRIDPSQSLKLNDGFGFHPALRGLKELFDAGQLGVIHGVGYPNPNRSHFRSTEIWQTASDSERFEKHGWIGRYFDHACGGAEPTIGVNVGRQVPQAFAARTPKGVSLDNPRNYRVPDFAAGMNGDTETGEMMRDGSPDDANAGGSIAALGGAAMEGVSARDYLERTALDAQVSSEQIRAVSERVQNQAVYPGSQLGNSLKLVARLIGGGLPTRIFYVSQGGYDTHANQAGAHERLLRDLGDSLKSFMNDMKEQGNSERVMVMTFSEFGRRVAENANGGTDHGAAAPMFVVGGKVKPGIHGTFPSLAPQDLFQGDLKFTTDFRRIYAGVLENWLKTGSVPVLGRKFEPFAVV